MLKSETTTLVLIDLQARLMPAIDGGPALVERCLLLARAARILGIPVLATEQNPQGLGGTIETLAGLPDRTIAKRSFDGAAEADLPAALGERRQVLAVGCETHVCVLQTVLGLKRRGLKVAVATDGLGSRRQVDRDAALKRMEKQGIMLYTAEMAIFEWLHSCDHPRFRDVLALVR